MMLFLKNTDGQPSASLTMAYVGFFIITAWLVFWIIGSSFGLEVPPFDETVALSYLTPLLGLYYGRRATGAAVMAKQGIVDGVESPKEGRGTNSQSEE